MSVTGTAGSSQWPRTDDLAICRCGKPIAYDEFHGWLHAVGRWYACRDAGGNPRGVLARPRVLPAAVIRVEEKPAGARGMPEPLLREQPGEDDLAVAVWALARHVPQQWPGRVRCRNCRWPYPCAVARLANAVLVRGGLLDRAFRLPPVGPRIDDTNSHA